MAMEGSFMSAKSVPLDVDKAIRLNVDATLSGEISNSNMVRALQEAHLVLSQLAGDIRETGPYTMDSLAPINEEIAAVLEDAYVGCIGVVEKDTGGPAAWASGALGDLLGFPGLVGDSKVSAAAKARILACIGEQNSAVDEAATRGLAALRAKEEEIVSGRRQEAEKGLECFIATAAYGTSSAAEIEVLRSFRDEVLLCSRAGRDLVAFYYEASPPLARYISEREWLRAFVRELLVDPIVVTWRATRPLWTSE